MLDRRWQYVSDYRVQQDAKICALDRLIASVADFFDFPIALVTLVGEEQWFIAKFGVEIDSTSLENAFCRHVVDHKTPLIVEDASRHPDFKHNPLVTGAPGIRFYAGVPLMANGKQVGAVCLIDFKPNSLSERDLRFLESLSYFLSDYIDLIDKRVNSNDAWMFGQLGDDVGVGAWEWLIPTGEVRFSSSWFYLLGIEPLYNKTSLSYWVSRVHLNDIDAVKEAVVEHLEGRVSAINVEFRVRHVNGSWIWFEINGRTFEYGNNKSPLRISGTSKNITAKKNEEVDERKQLCLLNFINKSQKIFLKEKNIKKSCDLVLEDLLVLADSEFCFIGQSVTLKGKELLFIHSLSTGDWYASDEEMYASYYKGRLYFEAKNNYFDRVMTNGEAAILNDCTNDAKILSIPLRPRILKRFLGLPVKIEGKSVGMVGLANKKNEYSQVDIRFLEPLLDTFGALFYALDEEKTRQRTERRLRYLAGTDVLTQLPNRRAFIEKLSAVGKLDEKPYSIAILDIDFFKAINDEYGHQVGDEVLVKVATRLRKTLRSHDFIARIGGEEFGVYVNHSNIGFSLDTLCHAVASTPIITSSGLINVTMSIGACLVSIGSQWESDLKRADHALYRAKKEGRNRVIWHEET